MGQIDNIDRKIINSLQTDASISIAALGEIVGLSQNACWRRVQKMESAGLLKARVALFDAEALGYGLTIFAIIRLNEHDGDKTAVFAKKMADIPEVVEFYRMSGDIDYMAKILARDVKHYDEIYKQLISLGPIRDVSSSFSMEEIKYTTAVPVLNR